MRSTSTSRRRTKASAGEHCSLAPNSAITAPNADDSAKRTVRSTSLASTNPVGTTIQAPLSAAKISGAVR